LKAAKEAYGAPMGDFEVTADVKAQWEAMGARGAAAHKEWQARFETLSGTKQAEFQRTYAGEAPKKLSATIRALKKQISEDAPKVATRKSSELTLQAINPIMQETIGGSADLTGSNNTLTADMGTFNPDNRKGRYIYYGVREHGMAAMMNGLAQHGGVIPYAGTFLVFTDYCRPSIRLSALMEQRVIYIMTHDSIGLGEDGPTHQPVEHLSSLRAMPNLNVFRPCDGVETAESWEIALSTDKTPSVLSLTRQGIPTYCEARSENMSAKGAYILKDCEGEPDVTLFASGSEVEIAMNAIEQINGNVRVVSAPCLDLFWQQDGEHIASILCNSSYKIAIEAASRQSWDRIIGGHNGTFIGMHSFGASAPAPALYEHFGITPEAVAEAANKKLEKGQ